jgi:RNA polymerase sigma factor (sigma-70 family)
MELREQIAHLFKSHFARIVAVISKQFGLQYLEVIEDIVSDAFLKATETWEPTGIPENPSGWIYTIARNKAHKFFTRNKIYTDKIIPGLTRSKEENDRGEGFLSDENIKDSQLQMIFAICNPAIVTEAQIGLALRILGGFSIEEIAEAFLTNKETINKRLFRAREKLRINKVRMEIPDDGEIGKRLDTVLHVIYLFFNEGYYSISHNQKLRKHLCAEALRLGVMLTEYKKTNLPKTNALVALMCYHASRFTARQGVDDSPILYKDQDRAHWDKNLIHRGNYYLMQAGKGDELTSYHIEARIAYCHSEQSDIELKWKTILDLYDQLVTINYSPAAELNRIYALFKVNGANDALNALDKFSPVNNHFYHTLLGELYTEIDTEKAKNNFSKAYDLAKSPGEKLHLSKKIRDLENRSHKF